MLKEKRLRIVREGATKVSYAVQETVLFYQGQVQVACREVIEIKKGNKTYPVPKVEPVTLNKPFGKSFRTNIAQGGIPLLPVGLVL